MLWMLAGVLLVLWLLGLVSHAMGGLIHLLLLAALIVALARLVTGRTRFHRRGPQPWR